MAKNDSVAIIACGWLGLPLAEQLLSNKVIVKGSVSTTEKISRLKEKNISAHVLHLSDTKLRCKDIEKLLEASVLCLILPFKRSFVDPEFYFNQINTLLPYIEASPIKRVLFTSSTSLYPCHNDTVTENTPFDHSSKRAFILDKTEKLLLENSKFETTVIRFSGLYGYDRKPGKFLSKKSDMSHADHPVNLIHRDDCIAIMQSLITHQQSNLIVNACSDNHPTKKVFYTWAAEKQGFNPPKFKTSNAPESGFKIVSNETLKHLLNYQFKYPDPLKDAP